MKKVVQLVEPEEHDCRSVKAVLEDLGYEAVAMGDVEAAVEVFPYLLPSLVLTAHPLPTADGTDFAGHVKRQSPGTLVVGMIRRGMREVARDALTHGCDDFLSKPVDAELLATKLHELIGRPEEEDSSPRLPEP